MSACKACGLSYLDDVVESAHESGRNCGIAEERARWQARVETIRTALEASRVRIAPGMTELTMHCHGLERALAILTDDDKEEP
jgi:hypothetical protein